MSDRERFAPPRGRKEVNTPSIMRELDELLERKCGDWHWLDRNVIESARTRLGHLLDESEEDRSRLGAQEVAGRAINRITALRAEVERLREVEKLAAIVVRDDGVWNAGEHLEASVRLRTLLLAREALSE